MDIGNVSATALRLPLKGLAIGDGLTDPLNQLYMADFYYQTGLLDEHQDLEIATDAKDARDCIKRKDWGDAASVSIATSKSHRNRRCI